jgi:Flp pilus assembly protein TadG
MVIRRQNRTDRKWTVIGKALNMRRRSGRGAFRQQPREQGAAVLEVAMVLPLLLLLLFGIIVFGVDIGLKQSVTHAAAEAAREAATAQPTTGQSNCTAWTNAATNTANKALNFLSANNPTVTVTFLDSSYAPETCTGSGTTFIQVKVTATSVLQNLPGIGVVAPTQVSSTATAQVQ